MRLRVRHQTIYRYESGSPRVTMLFKLKPRSYDGQAVLNWSVTVNGDSVENFAPNGHGDLEALWASHDRIDSATIIAEGEVETSDTAGIVHGLAPGPDPMVYLRDTPLTAASPTMAADAASIGEGDTLGRLHALSALVRERVVYRPGTTHSQTTAAEAYEMATGVCQDHAQIFIAMARTLGIPARYVSGYLLASEGEEQEHETHGWAEAWVASLGWIGFDVANSVCVTEHYVRLACGLDAHDAAPVRGSAVVSGAIHIDADVLINQSRDGRGGTQGMQAQEQHQQ